jgi:hypothetical protein
MNTTELQNALLRINTSGNEFDQRINFRTTAKPPKAMDNNNAELPASGTGGPKVANEDPVTMTTAKISRPREIFDFCIVI